MRQDPKILVVFAFFACIGLIACGDDGSSAGPEGGESSAVEESSSSSDTASSSSADVLSSSSVVDTNGTSSSIADTSAGDPGRDLDPDALVSMNFWGFQPAVFDTMQAYFEEFLKKADPADTKCECLLPVMVDALLKDGRITVDMLETEAVWFGVTYQEDRPLVQRALQALHDSGVYPGKL